MFTEIVINRLNNAGQSRNIKKNGIATKIPKYLQF